MENENLLTGDEGSNLRHEENLALLREGKGGLTIGSSYFGTEEQYRLAHGLDPEPSTEDAEASDLNESDPLQHETSIFMLTPGSAVYRADGMLPAVIESGEPAPVWCLPGDFKLFLEPGEDEHANLVREILVGSFRKFDDRNDHDIEPGNFYTEPEWDSVVGEPRTHVMQLVQEIGFDPKVERPDESKPRGESWLAERASADAEKQRMDAELSALKDQFAAANARASELEAQLDATPADSPVSSALPENALERLTAIKGVGEKLAGEILAALTSPATID